jgi:hypothetical protein
MYYIFVISLDCRDFYDDGLYEDDSVREYCTLDMMENETYNDENKKDDKTKIQNKDGHQNEI